MSNTAIRRVANSLKELVNDPIEGILAEIPDDTNMMMWNIWMEGPPDDFPMSPPKLTFVSEFWHPNVYMNGNVCISILHPPGEDEFSGELACERWLPTQTVASIMLSVISMLNDPNLSSPANVEASVMYRDRKDEFKARCRELVELSKTRLPAHVKIPHPETDANERKRAALKRTVMDEDEMMESFDAPMDSDDGMGMDEDEMHVDSSEDKPPPPAKVKKTAKDDKKNEKKLKDKLSASGKSSKKEKSASKNSTKKSAVVSELENESGEGSSESSEMDAKELQNLMAPDDEFKSWKRQWVNMQISRLTQKGWTHVKPSTKAGKGPKGLTQLCVMSYNVLRHTTAEGASRAVEQFRLIKEANPQFIVLNDVTRDFIAMLQDQQFLGGYFSVFSQDLEVQMSAAMESIPKTPGTMILSRHRITQAQWLSLPSRSDRGLARIEADGIGTHPVALLAVYLDDSPRDVKLRVQQLNQINSALDSFAGLSHIQIVMGDFGLSGGSKEHKAISKEYIDIWTRMYPQELGYTYDPDSNKTTKQLNSSAKPSRRDRILFKSETLSLSPSDVHIAGNSKLSMKYKGSSLWPSDHFALVATLAAPIDSSSPVPSERSQRCIIM